MLSKEYKKKWVIIKRILLWCALTFPSSFIIGNIVGLFFWSIDRVTSVRLTHQYIVWFLPVAGVAIYFIIRGFRETSNNIVLQNIHSPSNGVSESSSVPIFLTTVITHLFGGSAGREGATIQIGASISQFFAKLLKLNGPQFKVVCTSGIAAAFGAAFGAPIAGAFFALEIVREGSFPYNALVPCIAASIISTLTCSFWGIHNIQLGYIFSLQAHPRFNGPFSFNLPLVLESAVLGMAMGLVCCCFFLILECVKNLANKLISPKWICPLLGGGILVAMSYVFGNQDYLGLGVMSMPQNSANIAAAFTVQWAHTWSWLIKFLFVIVTLGFGFRGGEITPLIFIGASLGSVLAVLINAPIPLFACLGAISVLGGSANAPFACIILGIEMFGASYSVYYALVCFMAYMFSPTSKAIERLQAPMMPKLFDFEYIKQWNLDAGLESEKFEKTKEEKMQDYLDRKDIRN
jgi:H+/Cl- antiporter ClcA